MEIHVSCSATSVYAPVGVNYATLSWNDIERKIIICPQIKPLNSFS